MDPILGHITRNLGEGDVIIPYYSRVDEGTLDDLFSVDLSNKVGPGVYGAKAVVYIQDDGVYQVAFVGKPSEIHHIDVLAALIGEEDSRAQAVLADDWSHAQDVLDRSIGYEIQIKDGMIIGIQQSSVMTDRQKQRGRYLSMQIQENAFMALIEQISTKYIGAPYSTFECLEDHTLFL